jgi:O-methyltransferase
MFYKTVYGWLRNSPFGHRLAHRYPYMYTPRQLATLVSLLDEAATNAPSGQVVEVGCAAGHSTVFIAYHLAELAKRGQRHDYHAYDTFAGFPESDVDYEARRIPNIARSRFEGFQLNRQSWVQQSLDRNAENIAPVTLHCVNASEHDFAEIADLAFGLIDVDLHQPTARALERLWPKVSPGGVIVIDDCRLDPATGQPKLSSKFSGGHAALLEFKDKIGTSVQYLADKLAVLRKPVA